jgi:hypothetical protein
VDHPGDAGSAREHGCRFHRAWYAEDGSAFFAIANWKSREGAHAFFEEWEVEDEPGEVAIYLGSRDLSRRRRGARAGSLAASAGADHMFHGVRERGASEDECEHERGRDAEHDERSRRC